MKRVISVSCIAALALAVMIFFIPLTGCGGGGLTNSGGGNNNNPAPTASISVAKNPINKGDSTTLNWQTANATSVSISPGIGAVGPSGSQAISPSSTTTYVVTASGAGGSTQAQVTLTVNPATVTGLTLSADKTSLQYGETSQLKVIADLSDHTQQDVTNSSSYAINPPGFGSVSASGLYTAPSQTGSGTITATYASVTSNAITMTVSAPPLSLTSTNPMTLYLDNTQIVAVQVNGNGFAGGYQAQDCLGPFTLPPGVSPTQFTLTMGFDTPHWNPGWCDFSFTAPPSNTISMAFLGNQNDLAVAPSGEIFSLESGASIIHKFKPDMTPDGNLTNGLGGVMAFALDPKTGYLVMTEYNVGLIFALDENGLQISGTNGNYNPPQGVAVAADNGMGCVVQATYTTLDCDPDITIPRGTIVTATTDSDPHNVAMATATGNQEVAYVYTRGNSTLRAYNIPQMTPVNATQNLNLPTGTSNGFQLALLGTSVAAILDETNGTVVLINLTSMTELHRATIQGGTSFRLAADPASNAFVVAIADANNRLTHYASVDAGTGAVTARSATSTLLSVGLGNASNGTISCMRDQCVLVPNN